MVGAWCFLDRFGPIDVTPERTMIVGPHPHIGLHTVTWLLSGEVLHSDSLGNKQPIRPGQLNLMTAGGGIAHAEDARGQASGPMDGVQLWVAQPERTPDTVRPPSRITPICPGSISALRQATILIGEFAGLRSPATVDSALVGVDIEGSGLLAGAPGPGLRTCHRRSPWKRARLRTHGHEPNELVYLGTDREDLELVLEEGSRILLLGGRPVRRGDRHVVELRRSRPSGAGSGLHRLA